MKCANCFSKMKKEEIKCTTCGTDLHEECAVHCVTCGQPICDSCSLSNKFKCGECTKGENLDLEFVRRSHIEMYKTCPYSFYLEIIKGYEQKGNKWTEVGILLHDLFDKYSQLEDVASRQKEIEEEYIKMFLKLDDSLFNNEHDKRTMLDRGINSIKNYIRFEACTTRPFATEETVQINIGEGIPKIQVTIDRINKVGEELEIIDYKTGKVHVGKKLAMDLQPPTYIMAVREKYGVLPISFRLLFLDEDKERVYERIDDDKYVCRVNKNDYVISLQQTTSEIKSIFNKIKKRQFGIPSQLSTWHCSKMCKFGESGAKLCQGNIVESWCKQ